RGRAAAATGRAGAALLLRSFGGGDRRGAALLGRHGEEPDRPWPRRAAARHGRTADHGRGMRGTGMNQTNVRELMYALAESPAPTSGVNIEQAMADGRSTVRW